MPDENPDKPAQNAPEEEAELTDDQLADVSGGVCTEGRRRGWMPTLPGKTDTH